MHFSDDRPSTGFYAAHSFFPPILLLTEEALYAPVRRGVDLDECALFQWSANRRERSTSCCLNLILHILRVFLNEMSLRIVILEGLLVYSFYISMAQNAEYCIFYAWA